MSQFIEWAAMGGYGVYIWPTYGVVTLLLIFNAVNTRWQYKKTLNRLRAWFASK